jgi:hypothetical protein
MLILSQTRETIPAETFRGEEESGKENNNKEAFTSISVIIQREHQQDF